MTNDLKRTYSSSSALTIGKDIDYPEALKRQLSGDECITILSPFGKFKDYIFIFPSWSNEKLSDKEDISHKHKNFIFYKGEWLRPKDLFRDVEVSSCLDSDLILVYLRKKQKNYYRIPFSYFDLTSPKSVEFRQNAIQPIRRLFSRLGLITPDKRGKGSEKDRQIREQIYNVVISAFKKAKKKRPIPFKFIQKELRDYLEKIFLNEPELYDKYSISDATIRRILKREGLI